VRRRRVVVLVAAVSLGAAWAGPLAGAMGRAGGPEPVAARSYVVRGGDTLWGIAERVAPEADPRSVVDAIAAANAVDAGSLVPGQTLVIPGV
jgi:nucleoid-associated protein YgaU